MIYGFRVVEPHHDGCPHWHGLFFMDKAHRKVFRRIVARYGCRADREELGLSYFETDKARMAAAREVQAAQKAAGEETQSLSVIKGHLKLEEAFWAEADWRTFKAVQARVDFEAINWAKGTAAGYIAKYIAKNIDGKNAYGEGVGDDYEADGVMSAVDAAVRVDAWAGTWGIRQFQQIGGAPVTVWRELRREFVDDVRDDGDIIRAARAADLGDWGKFTQIMGGVATKRADRPVQLYKELPMRAGEVCLNRYGEPMGKAIRGVFALETGEIRFTRVHEWAMVFKKTGADAPAWTRVNNSTDFASRGSFVNKCKEISPKTLLSQTIGGLSGQARADAKRVLSDIRDALDGAAAGSLRPSLEAERDWIYRQLADMRSFEETGRLRDGRTPLQVAESKWADYQAARQQADEAMVASKQEAQAAAPMRQARAVLTILDAIQYSPRQLMRSTQREQRRQAELQVAFKALRTRPLRFVPPRKRETVQSVLSEARALMTRIERAYCDDCEMTD